MDSKNSKHWRPSSIKWNLISNGNHWFTWSFGTSCLLRSMTMKHHQTGNGNILKIAWKNKKNGRSEIFAKTIKADTNKNDHYQTTLKILKLHTS